MDYKTLAALRPADFSEAAQSYRSASNAAQANREQVERRIAAKLRSKVAGQAANAAQTQLTALGKNFHYIQVECGLISTSLHALSTELATAKKKLTTAVADAQAEKFTVNADGSVTYPAAGTKVDGKVPAGGTVQGRTSSGGSGGPFDPGSQADSLAKSLDKQAARLDPNPNSGRAQEYANRIASAVKEATEADTRWAPKLRKLLADDDLTVSNRDWADTAKDRKQVGKAAGDYLEGVADPPKDGSPKENSAWWEKLSQDERDAYISLKPASIGAMDGLPAVDRDTANRIVHREETAATATALAQHKEGEPKKYCGQSRKEGVSILNPEWKRWNSEKERLEGIKKGLREIDGRFKETGRDGLPEAYLLGLSTKENGQTIIANGNPDDADRTAVYVPGTGSKLEGIEGDMRRMNELWQQSQAMTGDKKVSTITWLGYDAPQGLVKDATRSSFADEGATAFNKFMDGVEAANQTESGGQRIAVGHSYGSTLIGSAARQGTLNADDVIFAGSPGVQVERASQLGVPDGHVWNQEAKKDHVPDAGKLGHGKGFLEFNPHNRQHGFSLDFGVSTPSHDRFGANQMTTDAEGHSDYWKRGTQSLKNQAAVVAGKHGKAHLED